MFCISGSQMLAGIRISLVVMLKLRLLGSPEFLTQKHVGWGLIFAFLTSFNDHTQKNALSLH